MKKQLICLCAVACLGFAALAADSQSEEGFYTKIGAGASFQGDIKIEQMDGIQFPAALEGEALAEFLLDIGYEGELPAGTTGSLGKPKIKTDTGFNLSLAAGYRFSESLSLELESGFIYNSVKSLEQTLTLRDSGGVVIDTVTDRDNNPDVDLYQIPLLANVIYTFPLEGNLKPYLGAGVGGVWVVVDGSGVSENDLTFAWQVMAGADYEINEQWSAGLGYKLMGTSGCDWDGMKTEPFLTHSIVATLTFKF